MKLAISLLSLLCLGCSSMQLPSASPVRDKRVYLAALETVAAWEDHFGAPIVFPSVVFGTPVGVTTDVCGACLRPPGCEINGCFSPARAAIVLSDDLDEEQAYEELLPHEYIHVLQFVEHGGKIDLKHTDEVWTTVLPTAQKALR